MRDLLGTLFIIIGAALGIYVGGYLLLFGGIVQVINSVSPLDAACIATGIIKILFCDIGYVIFWIGTVIGIVVMD